MVECIVILERLPGMVALAVGIQIVADDGRWRTTALEEKLRGMDYMREIADIHQPFIVWLKKEKIPYVYHRSDKKSGIAVGWPDFTLCLRSTVLLIEGKNETGKLSPDQENVHAFLIGTGTKPVICRSLEECVKITEAWRKWVDRDAMINPDGEITAEPERRIPFGGKVIVTQAGKFVRFEKA